ncbi:MAG: GNAT family N-acetyltransferase [Deltaproteobacteria bacterium]|nr:GNAT family N-acetyltransferase [Deltaproteobacteria bacterium]
MEVRKANLEDIAGILQLLTENKLPLQGVAVHLQNFLVLAKDGQIIGCAGLEIYGMVALLRSVAIRKDRRCQGLGRTIVEEIFNLAIQRKSKKLYLLTATAPEFFQKIGFKRIDRGEADPLIQQTEEFRQLCPLSAIVMVKELT